MVRTGRRPTRRSWFVWLSSSRGGCRRTRRRPAWRGCGRWIGREETWSLPQSDEVDDGVAGVLAPPPPLRVTGDEHDRGTCCEGCMPVVPSVAVVHRRQTNRAVRHQLREQHGLAAAV